MSQLERQVIDGIETISCFPDNPVFGTPIIFLHGMWHGAWCWENWQKELGKRGRESHAISLSGHGASPASRSIRLSTLGLYQTQVEREIARHQEPPVLIAHSMGGAIAQRCIKNKAKLAGCVLLASWPASGVLPATLKAMKQDPVGALQSFARLELGPMVRSPERARSMFLTAEAQMSAEDLCAQLGSNSFLALLQFMWPLWRAPKHVEVPLLWVSAEQDGLFDLRRCEASAQRYSADHIQVGNCGHDIMLEQQGHSTLSEIQNWLKKAVPETRAAQKG